jgi:hypothetical protein
MEARDAIRAFMRNHPLQHKSVRSAAVLRHILVVNDGITAAFCA